MAPYRELDIKTIRRMMQKTSDFLSVCCRDVLDTEETQSEIQMMDGPTERVEVRGYAYLLFNHRTIFDYLKTRETSELLNKHMPPGFCDVDFRVKLTIAEAKIAYNSCTVERKVEVVSNNRTRVEMALANLCGTQLQEGEGTVVRLAQEADEIALRCLLDVGRLGSEALEGRG